MKSVSFVAACLCYVLGCSVASAATLYVDGRHGNDFNGMEPGTCKKTAPCQTIQMAINVGGKGTRVLVAPGTYFENLVITEDSVTIQSVSGKDTTSINSNAETIIDVTGDRFTLGGKGKGFYIFASFDTDQQSGIVVTGDRAKIEHNDLSAFDSGTFSETDYAIRINGSKATIRYNQIDGFEFGVFSNVGDSTRSDHQIMDNELFSIGDDCIEIVAAAGSRDKIRNNYINFCNYSGNPYDGIELTYTSGTTTAKPDIRDNYIDGTAAGVSVENAKPSIRNNRIGFAQSAVQLESTSGASVRDNRIVNGNDTDAPSVGLRVITPTGARNTISGNSFEDLDIALNLDANLLAPYNTISKNNFSTLFSDDCVVELDTTAPPTTVKFSGNFWGFDGIDGEDGPAGALLMGGRCQVGNFEAAANNGSVTFSRSSSIPLASRYKGQQP